jgi:DNA-binding SARP family transcriptional activator
MTVLDPTSPPLAIRLFGPFEVYVHGHPLPRLRSRKCQWLLALLTLRHGCAVDRSWLAGTLWPGSRADRALALLRRDLYDLRRALGPEGHRLRSPTPRTLCLDLPGAAADVSAFDRMIASRDPGALERAITHYRGRLLEGCTEEWADQERQAREEAYLTALERLASHASANADGRNRCLLPAPRHCRGPIPRDSAAGANGSAGRKRRLRRRLPGLSGVPPPAVP